MSTNDNIKNVDIQMNLTKNGQECPGYISPKLKIKVQIYFAWIKTYFFKPH